MNYAIRPHHPDEPVPNDLLLLADENQTLIDTYLPNSELYVIEVAEQIVGVGVLQITGSMGEIMNIAVAPDQQRKGLGRALLRYLIDVGKQAGLDWLLIATGNSGIHQLTLYQQEGFDLLDIDLNYFLRTYPDPIWENGIQCKHRLIFQYTLKPESPIGA